MKRNKSFILCMLFMLGCGYVQAQEELDTPDSVIVLGTVVDHLTEQPQPFCQLQFIRETDTTTVRCDEEGYFVSTLRVGNYTLSVSLKGQQVYQADLVLNDNAALHIAVITDSFSFRRLKVVDVVEMRHLLGKQGMLIDTPDEPRLWDFTYCDWCPWSLPPHYGGADAPALGTPFVKWGRFYRSAKGRKDARIWQLLWPDRPAPADTNQRKKSP